MSENSRLAAHSLAKRKPVPEQVTTATATATRPTSLRSISSLKPKSSAPKPAENPRLAFPSKPAPSSPPNSARTRRPSAPASPAPVASIARPTRASSSITAQPLRKPRSASTIVSSSATAKLKAVSESAPSLRSTNSPAQTGIATPLSSQRQSASDSQTRSRLPRFSVSKSTTDPDCVMKSRNVSTSSSHSRTYTSRIKSLSNTQLSPTHNGDFLDMKQLLSKPASVHASDSESCTHSSNSRTRTRSASDNDASRSLSRSEAPKEPRSGPVDENNSFLNLASPLSPSPSDRGRVGDFRPRNVLRRKSSARMEDSSQSLHPPSHQSPAHSVSSSRCPSRSSVSERRSTSRHREASPTELTPAKEVVMAYKQKEQLHISHQARGNDSDGNAAPTRTTENESNLVQGNSRLPVGSRSTIQSVQPEEERDPTPYYTVLGSTSGRVVAVGGPEDAWSEFSLGSGLTASLLSNFGHHSYNRPSTASAAEKTHKTDGLGKTLTRKVSGRFRKTSQPTDISRDDSSRLSSRISLQERRVHYDMTHSSAGGDIPPRLSLDRPRPELSGSRPVPESFLMSDLGTGHQSKDAGLLHNQPRSRKSEPGSKESGNKIWKLMKRISTGTLRESSSFASGIAPPVPALPDYVRPNGPRSVDGYGREEGFMTSPSTSNTRIPKAVMPLPPLSPVPPVPSQPSTSTHRPSTATSSPVSSDVASSKFFHRTHSQRSSTSSLGEEITRPPVPTIPQHIVSPSELRRLELDFDAEAKHKKMGIKPPKLVTSFQATNHAPSSDDWMVVQSPQAEPLSLGPFRRHQQRRFLLPDESGRVSPNIPEFSTAEPINTFSSRKPKVISKEKIPAPSVSTSPITAPLSPPPRPSKSPRRPSPSVSVFSSPVVSPVTSPALVSRIPRSLNETASPIQARRKSTSTPVSTPEVLTNNTTNPSNSSSPITPRSSARSRMTFREMSEQKHAWTEKEKNEMWQDLLERSDRAGGTLHLAGATETLPSDELRFSSAASDLLI